MVNKMISEEELIKIRGYFDKVIQLVRYNKTKDDIIERTGKDIQRYRDGFALSVFKPLAISIINYRENCKKELADLEKYEYDEAKLKKNFNYLIDDLQDVLLENGIDEVENGYEYCGRNIMQPISFGEDTEDERTAEAAPEAQNAQVVQIEASEVVTEASKAEQEEAEKEYDLAATLEAYQQQIVDTLADNSKIEALLKQSFDGARKRDDENKRIFVYPIFYRLASLKYELSGKIENFPLEGVGAKAEYAAVLAGVVADMAEILQLMGVTVEIAHSETDKIVSGFHQLIKVVPTEIADDDRKIARAITDAYSMDGKIIYPQKVEVYKFKK